MLAMRTVHSELVESDAYRTVRHTLWDQADLDLPPTWGAGPLYEVPPPKEAWSASQSRPRLGWSDILVGLLASAVVGLGGSSQLARLYLDPMMKALIFTAWSGIAGMVGYAAAGLAAGQPMFTLWP
ncbi:hypothetical protein ABIB57_002125 [Devosia sp. UYZn731]|uniref:hypothetical protein n=1 Tax=Devosia sp. UYZn731 TaxID=3156345 RepID=UPI0033920E1A